ncbi:MAG: lipoyl(octanoyl) transferase [Acidobacteria bacterium]|nr:MAG: lipoyl(octanoyl) transferase [Acidobacteriota bacterium]
MISVIQFETVDYATGLRLQQRLVELRKESRIGDVLLLLEHTPVITLGRNAKAKNILASSELLAQRGVEVFECDRGGDVTFHGPGQIVGYPIFDLRGFISPEGKRKTLGAIEYVRHLEDVLIRTCADFGISAHRIPGFTGVWTIPVRVGTAALDCAVEQSSTGASAPTTDEVGTGVLARPGRAKLGGAESKIAAIGVHISRAVTSHGFALNVSTDLGYFDLIVPCGIESKPVTSMERELGKQIALQDVAHSLARNFGAVFDSQILFLENLDALLGEKLGVPMKPPSELRELHKEDKIFWA